MWLKAGTDLSPWGSWPLRREFEAEEFGLFEDSGRGPLRAPGQKAMPVKSAAATASVISSNVLGSQSRCDAQPSYRRSRGFPTPERPYVKDPFAGKRICGMQHAP